MPAIAAAIPSLGRLCFVFLGNGCLQLEAMSQLGVHEKKVCQQRFVFRTVMAIPLEMSAGISFVMIECSTIVVRVTVEAALNAN